MSNKEIEDIILNYNMTEELLNEYLQQDFKKTIIGITNALIELLKSYNKNKDLINELLLIIENIINSDLDIKKLKILKGEIRNTCSNIHKTLSPDKNIYILNVLKQLQSLNKDVKQKITFIESKEKLDFLEDVIYQNRNLKLISSLIRDNKDILKIKDENSENILYKLLKKYSTLEIDNTEEIYYLYQVISLFINNDDMNIEIIECADYYIDALKGNSPYIEEIRYQLEKRKEQISLKELENRFNVYLTYPKEAEEELYTYKFSHNGMVDLTRQKAFTIDDEESSCLDDAIYLSENKDGSYTLYVHITYIPALIPYDSLVNRESIRITETRYLIDGAYSLYPEYVSNYLASLLPNNIRHTETGIWLLEPDLTVVEDSFRLVKSNICSHRRLSYDEADCLMEKSETGSLNNTLYLLGNFALKQRRINSKKEKYREKENTLNPNKKHESFITDKSVSANIIQETALLFGHSKAMLYKEKGLPFIYRACGEAQEFKLNKETISNKSKDNFSTTFAYYTDKPERHCGLGYTAFAHTTSPARRSPDGQNQYIDEDLLFNQNPSNETIYAWEERTKQLAKHYNEEMQKIEVFSNQYNYLESKKLIRRP